MRKAFTLIELAVSIAILVVVLLIASKIFRVCIESHRVAMANAEIMQKFRAITDQLNADFKGLRKDGEICVAWVAKRAGKLDGDDLDGYLRMDRIMFFANGDFQSYGLYGTPPDPVRGHLARICYSLARDKNNTKPDGQQRRKRRLARTQHILVNDADLAALPPFAQFNNNDQGWRDWNKREHERISLGQWMTLPLQDKVDMLSVILDIEIQPTRTDERIRGSRIDGGDPNSIHLLMCEGVGEFMVQGWHKSRGNTGRWIPEVDPDGDGSLIDSHFILDPNGSPILHKTEAPGLWYPRKMLQGRGPFAAYKQSSNYPQNLDAAHFDMIPGLGRALKFTFTLYDSKGVLKKGRTFTHIVYLN